MAFIKATRIWTTIGSIAAVIVLIPTLYDFCVNHWKRPKAFRAGLISYSTLLNEGVRNDGNGIRVFFGNDLVKNFTIVNIRIKNSGRSPLLATDFEAPPTIKFKNVHKIYFTKATDRHPHDLNPQVILEFNVIKVVPLLLNSRDSFVIEAGIDLGSQPGPPEIEVGARIAGVTYVDASPSGEGKKSKKGQPFFFSLIVIIVLPLFLIFGVYKAKAYYHRYNKILDTLHGIRIENQILRKILAAQHGRPPQS